MTPNMVPLSPINKEYALKYANFVENNRSIADFKIMYVTYHPSGTAPSNAILNQYLAQCNNYEIANQEDEDSYEDSYDDSYYDEDDD